MNFNELLNKGKNILNKGTNAVKEAAKEKIAARQEFDLLITRSDHLTNLLPYEIKNTTPSPGREQMMITMCLTLNVENAKYINNLIPIDETIVNIKTAKEAKTELLYWFIITNKCLWIANKKEYKIYSFESIQNCEIIDKSIMSQYVKFDSNAFIFDGNESDVRIFCNVLMDVKIRNLEISKATSYLCGTTPKEQYLNLYLTGMTIGENDQIVFHNGKAGNKLVNKKDIEYVQLLMDNTVVMSKGKPNIQSMVSATYDCRKMSIKVVLTNENYLVDVMPQNMMGTMVKKEDSVYITNYEFAKNIINRIEELLRQW